MSKNHHHRKAHRFKQLVTEAEHPKKHGAKVYETPEGIVVRVAMDQWVPDNWKLISTVPPEHGEHDG